MDLLHNVAFGEGAGEEKDGSNASTYAQRNIHSVPVALGIGKVWLMPLWGRFGRD